MSAGRMPDLDKKLLQAFLADTKADKLAVQDYLNHQS
jgi:hypothetical protein